MPCSIITPLHLLHGAPSIPSSRLRTMTDYLQEQEMEIEALQAILMDEIEELDPSERGLQTTSRCFMITISPTDEDEEGPNTVPVRLGLIFAHTDKYPDEPPLLEVRSLRGISNHDLEKLKQKLEDEAAENLGMAMVYTLATSAKEWLRERYNQNIDSMLNGDSDEEPKDEIIEPHGEAVTIETFIAWRERFEAELALERARLLPDSALIATKERRISGRVWFESGGKGVKAIIEEVDDQDEEDLDFDEDFDDGDVDEDDMLEHYLSGKSSGSSSFRA